MKRRWIFDGIVLGIAVWLTQPLTFIAALAIVAAVGFVLGAFNALVLDRHRPYPTA